MERRYSRVSLAVAESVWLPFPAGAAHLSPEEQKHVASVKQHDDQNEALLERRSGGR